MIILKNIFVGVFPSHFITKFITFHRMMNEKSTRYPFIIMNTDLSDKKSTHWSRPSSKKRNIFIRHIWI